MAIKIQARPTSRATTRLTVTHGWRIWCSNPVGLKQNQVSLCIKTRLFNDIGISDYSSKLTVVPCCWNRGWSDHWSFAGSERGRALRNTLCAKSKACQLNPKQSPRWCVSEAQTEKEGGLTERGESHRIQRDELPQSHGAFGQIHPEESFICRKHKHLIHSVNGCSIHSLHTFNYKIYKVRSLSHPSSIAPHLSSKFQHVLFNWVQFELHHHLYDVADLLKTPAPIKSFVCK